MTTYIPALTLPRPIFENAAASILLPITLGTAVGYGSSQKNTRDTYARFKQPPGNPPPQVFGPVWTILYGLMGYAAYRVYNIGLGPGATLQQAELARQGTTLYSIQLALNLAWTPLFFVLRRPIEASINIIALWGLNAYLAYTYSQVDQVAGWLQIPYLGWLSFATYLCVGVGYLNNWDISDRALVKGKGKAL